MKIGIITFHKAENVGACLQAYATYSYIKDTYNQDTELIDFVPNNLCNDCGLAHRIAHYLKVAITFPFTKSKRKRREKFAEFFKLYNCSADTYYGDGDLEEKKPEYDLLISGSDQILNVNLSGDSTSFYLAFDDKAIKASYASSFGRSDISNKEIDLVKTELSRFDFLSARELSTKNIIENNTGREVYLVCDPVFLLDKAEWAVISNGSKKSNYIFIYAMEITSWLLDTISRVRSESNKKMIAVLGGGGKISVEGVATYECCGPQEFLSLIREADLVITNSFHGTAFSIIFEKEFLCLAHSSRNARLENILRIIGAQNQMIDEKRAYHRDNSVIKPHEYLHRMDKLIEQSKEYLDMVMERVGE